MDRGRAIAAAAVLLAVALVGCVAPVPPSSPPPEPTPIPTVQSSPALVATAEAEATPPTVPSLDPDRTAHPGVTCDPSSDIAFSLDAIDGPGVAEFAPDPAASALRKYLAEDGGLMPDTGWHRVVQTARTAMFVARDAAPGAWVRLAFTSNGPTWDLEAEGACAIQLSVPTGFSPATWEIDPAHPPRAADRSVTVLATEQACASGHPIGDRLLPPSVTVRPDAIVITLVVRHRPGGQDCPGNPAVTVKVDIGQPLGDRRLVDGADPAAALE